MRFAPSVFAVLTGCPYAWAALTMSEVIESLTLHPPVGMGRIDPTLWRDLQETIGITGDPVIVNLARLYKTSLTGVYEILQEDNSAAKLALVYRQFCGSSAHPINPILIDYWFLQFLQLTEIVPAIYDVSSPMYASEIVSPWWEIRNEQVSLKLLDGKFQINPNCRNDVVPEIRYLLMERLPGSSVSAIRNRFFYEEDERKDGMVPVTVAIDLTIKMVRTVEKLHKFNVVHGDAHFGNFIAGPDNSMKMIDFERARIFNRHEMASTSTCDPTVLRRSRWNSPWESQKCVSSFRDDIHRVFVCFGIMLHGDLYLNYLNTISGTAYHELIMGRRQHYPRMTEMFESFWKRHRFGGEIFETKQPYLMDEMFAIRAIISNDIREDTFLIDNLCPGCQNLPAIKSLFHQLEQYVINMDITDEADHKYILKTLESLKREFQRAGIIQTLDLE